MTFKNIILVGVAIIGYVFLSTVVRAEWKIVDPLSDNVTISEATSIAVDTNNMIHLLFSNANKLVYLTNSGPSGAWATNILDSNNGKPQGDIIVDNTGVVHISYYVPDISSTGGSLMYATDGNGTLVSTLIEKNSSKNGVGQENSIAVDGGGVLHVSYYDSSLTQLKHASKSTDSSWNVGDVVDSGAPVSDVGRYSSIVADGSNKLHISYYDATSQQLKYASGTSGSWGTLVVEAGSDDIGRYSSIAVDANGKIHISYYDFTSNELKYATNSSGSWKTEIVDSHVDAQSSSIAVSPDASKVAISYGKSNKLQYAEGTFGKLSISTIDTDNNSGQYSAIALDNSGHSYISYYYNDNITNVSKMRVAYQYDPVGGVPGGCFLTSVFIGTPFESSLRTLKRFRDKVLNNYFIGRQLVAVYYKYSPQAANFIEGHGGLRSFVSWILLPLVGLSWLILKIGFSLAIVLGGVFGFVCFPTLKKIVTGDEVFSFECGKWSLK